MRGSFSVGAEEVEGGREGEEGRREGREAAERERCCSATADGKRERVSTVERRRRVEYGPRRGRTYSDATKSDS